MLAVVGVLLLAGSALLFAQTLLARRNPATPAWATRKWTVEAAIWAAVIGFFIGAALAMHVLTEPHSQFGWIEGSLTIVVVAIFAVTWSRMRVGKRLAEYKKAAAPLTTKPVVRSQAAATAVNGPDDSLAPKPAPGAGGGSGRKAA